MKSITKSLLFTTWACLMSWMTLQSVQAAPTLAVNTSVNYPQVTAEISMINSPIEAYPSVAGVQFDIFYDPTQLQFDNAVNAANTSQLTLHYSTPASGQLRVLYTPVNGDNNVSLAEGLLVAANFSRIGAAQFTGLSVTDSVTGDQVGAAITFPASNTDTIDWGPAGDADNDGIPDYWDPDDDNDGMPDAWETQHGVTDALADADEDGINNLREYQLGSDPNFNDTDSSRGDMFYGWTNSFGGTGSESSESVAVGADGSVYVTGNFTGSVDFGSGSVEGVDMPTSTTDIFVSKYDAAGNLVWTRTMGGPGLDRGLGIAVDAADNVYVSGMFYQEIDVDPSPVGVYTLTDTLATNFVVKLDTNGNFVDAAQFAGSQERRYAQPIFVDDLGNVFVTGDFNGTENFDLYGQLGVDVRSATGGDFDSDVFLTKLDVNLDYAWTYTFGGDCSDQSNWVTMDAMGELYIAGHVCGEVDFNPAAAGGEYSAVSSRNGYVAKIDASGGFVWATPLAIDTDGEALAVDDEGNVYLGGNVYGGGDFDSSEAGEDLRGDNGRQGYITKFDSAGNYQWARMLGEYVYGIGLDSAGDLYVAGDFRGTTIFDSVIHTQAKTALGSDDIFVTKFTANGDFAWTEVVGGLGDEHISGLVIDQNDDLYLTGRFEGSVGFNIEDGGDMHVSAGGDDVFVTKWTRVPPVQADVCPSGCAHSSIQSAVDAATYGDTITVGPGTYNEAVSVSTNLTLQSVSGPEDTIVDATGLGQPVFTLTNYQSTIDGFTVMGGQASSGGAFTVSQSGAIIRNNIIKDNHASRGGGVFAPSGYDAYMLIEDNVFEGNTADYYGGAIMLGRTATQIVQRNTFRNNSALRGGAIACQSYGSDVVKNNLFVNNTNALFFQSYAATKLINNTIVGSTGYALSKSSYGGINFVNGILWENESNLLGWGWSVQNSLVDVDPLFVDPANENYRLQPGSPAIDTGMDVTSLGLTEDYDRYARPYDGDGLGAGSTGDGSDYDSGAFEYH